jgi:hypothetical protein
MEGSVLVHYRTSLNAVVPISFLSPTLYHTHSTKLYPTFPANCFLAMLGLKLAYGVWLTLFRWMPSGPLFEYLAYPGTEGGCYVASFVDSFLQLMILAVNTTQMTMVFYTLYLGVVMGTNKKRHIMRRAAQLSVGVCLAAAATVLSERSTSQMAWCTPGKVGTVVKVNLLLMLIITQTIMICACTYKLNDSSSMLPSSIRRSAIVRIWAIVVSQLLGIVPVMVLEFMAVAQYHIPHGLVWWFVLGFPLSCFLDVGFVVHRFHSMRASIRQRNIGKGLRMALALAESPKGSRELSAALSKGSSVLEHGTAYGPTSRLRSKVRALSQVGHIDETIKDEELPTSLPGTLHSTMKDTSNTLYTELGSSLNSRSIGPAVHIEQGSERGSSHLTVMGEDNDFYDTRRHPMELPQAALVEGLPVASPEGKAPENTREDRHLDIDVEVQLSCSTGQQRHQEDKKKPEMELPRKVLHERASNDGKGPGLAWDPNGVLLPTAPRRPSFSSRMSCQMTSAAPVNGTAACVRMRVCVLL